MGLDQNGEYWDMQNTPTWAVATVCTVFVSFGLLAVYGIENIEERLKQAKRKPLVHALQKMKEELMLLGFISLLIAMFRNYVSSICIRTAVLHIWNPCRAKSDDAVDLSAFGAWSPSVSQKVTVDRRRLLAADSDGERHLHRRMLIRDERVATFCPPEHSPIVSVETLHELHTFIFVLACVHILYSLFAMLLASTKVNGWLLWEQEANEDHHDNLAEVVQSVSLYRQTTFIKYHTSKPWSGNRFIVWVTCFFRQFRGSVVRSDYLALRHGFIKNNGKVRNFDFHGYLIRHLEDEYQKVVGISATLWFFVVIFMLFNVVGSNLFFWLSFLPPMLLLVLGTKLQHIIASMALEDAGFNKGDQYAGKLIQPDELFWFHSPQFILSLIHFVFFQNAFEMATFLSYAWQFGFHTCLLDNKPFVITRVAIGVIVQIICSYSTLPLYSLVTQMGSYQRKQFAEDLPPGLAKTQIPMGDTIQKMQI